jgi:hypothetical protein
MQPTAVALRRRVTLACTQSIPTLKNAHDLRILLCINLWVAKENRVCTRSWSLFTERTRLCLLVKAFEAMRDRKKSRTSSRFVSTDAVAHLLSGSVIPAPLCARFQRPASAVPAVHPQSTCHSKCTVLRCRAWRWCRMRSRCRRASPFTRGRSW